MSNIIAVIGATGAQGGSVAHKFLQDKSWKVRAITRNVNSDAAKSLASLGAEVVFADLDDEPSLLEAFEGATAIFGVTNFWEHIYSKSISAEECMDIEYGQACALANAVAKTPSLKHYIWSTIPSSEVVSNGKVKVYHFDGKAKADDYIRDEHPELAVKTTFLWVGYYPANMAIFPMMKVTPMPPPAPHLWLQTSPASTMVPSAGDVTINVGLIVSAIIAQPHLSLPEKYAVVEAERPTTADILKMWAKITGQAVEFVKIDTEAYVRIWGPAGEEVALNMEFYEEYPDPAGWGRGRVLGREELGVEGLVGTERALEGVKGGLMS